MTDKGIIPGVSGAQGPAFGAQGLTNFQSQQVAVPIEAQSKG